MKPSIKNLIKSGDTFIFMIIAFLFDVAVGIAIN